MNDLTGRIKSCLKLNFMWVMCSTSFSLVYPLHCFNMLMECWYGTRVSFMPWMMRIGHFTFWAVVELSRVYFRRVDAHLP